MFVANKTRYAEFVLIIGFQLIFLFLTIFPSTIVDYEDKSLQYSSTIICQGFFDRCCSPWSTHCMKQKMAYWNVDAMQSINTFRTTQILGFLLHLFIGTIVLLILFRSRIIIRKQTSQTSRVRDIRIAYIISAVAVIVAFAVTEQIPQPFGPISRRNYVMITEFMAPPLLLLLAGITAQA
jgi:hypothetical protein